MTIDTLRDDHVGRRPAGDSLTPQIDRLGHDGVRFTNTLTSATTTLASHASMLTGLRPHRHGLQGNEGGLDAAIPAVGKLLRMQGVRTGAVVSSFVLRSEGGLAPGFETYDETFDGGEESRSGQRVKSPGLTTRVALDWLRRFQRESFFLWVHYFPPHGPYTPPAGFLDVAAAPGDQSGSETLVVSKRNYERGRIPAYQRLDGLTGAGPYRTRYAGHVRYVDSHVGDLLAGMREMGLYDQALVIVTSDHGESLGEHGWYFCHGNLVYGEQARVPLIAKWPAERRRRDSTLAVPVELVDIAPTVLGFFDLTPSTGMDGINLESLLADPDAAAGRTRITQSTDGELTAAVVGGWKLTRRSKPERLVDGDQPWLELFHIDEDPSESDNLAQQQSKIVGALESVLPADRRRQGEAELSAETEERLRAMGYIE